MARIAFLNPAFLEHFLPILHAFLHVTLPPRWCARIEVIHNWFDRLDKFTTCVRRRIFRLESPPRDEFLTRGFLFIESVVHTINGEESNARIGIARTHRNLRQQESATDVFPW